MKNSSTILKIFITAGFFSFLLLNAGSLRCESPPAGRDNLSPQAKRTEPMQGKTWDGSRLNEREASNERFKEMEWLIKQNLMKQYEKMEVAGNFDDDVE